MIITAAIIALLIAACGCIAGAIRNRQVYKYRLHILDTIAEHIHLNPYDIDWRIEAYKKVGYNEMVFKFWKRLDSFYPDKSFLDLNDVRGHAPWEKTA